LKTHLRDFIQGIKAGLPIAIGYVPIAIAFGALALKANLSIREAVLMSILVFAGASQFMAASMILAGSSGIQIIIATLFLNLRHLIMSMSIHNTFLNTNKLWSAILSFGITDETFAVITLQNKKDQPPPTHYFSAGLMGIAHFGWVSGTVIGTFGAHVIPAEVSSAMTLGLYAMFIGLLMPHVRRSLRIGLIAGSSMILCTAFNLVLESGWAIVLATIVGALIGVMIGEEQT